MKQFASVLLALLCLGTACTPARTDDEKVFETAVGLDAENDMAAAPTIQADDLDKKSAFIKSFDNFKTITLPFEVDYSTFDIYACEDSTVKLEESFVREFLLSENDEFLTRKSQSKLRKNTYHDYYLIGKICIKGYTVALYYRDYVTTTDYYTELMACIFDANYNLCQTLSLSKMDTQLGIYSFCDISEEGVIAIRYYSEAAVDKEDLNTGIIKEVKYKITDEKEGEPFQKY